MRELRFRALKDDISNCNFIYGMLIYSEDKEPRIQEHDGGLFITCLEGTEGQWTGLKDKNGKEIYEGDIVQYDCGTKAKVIFKNGCFIGYDGYATSSDEAYLKLIDDEYIEKPDFECEIIGNIYQNKDLIKTL